MNIKINETSDSLYDIRLGDRMVSDQDTVKFLPIMVVGSRPIQETSEVALI